MLRSPEQPVDREFLKNLTDARGQAVLRASRAFFDSET